jgi:rRNA maturation endonuclease Nob1
MKDKTHNVDRKSWRYACSRCGSPYKSKPAFCYDCEEPTVVPISDVIDAIDQHGL